MDGVEHGKYSVYPYGCNCPDAVYRRRTCKHLRERGWTREKEQPKQALPIPQFDELRSWDEAKGWIWSEKYDGVRAYWDGSRMWTRTGRPIIVPIAVRPFLPASPLDGELWISHEAGPNVTMARVASHDWTGVRYVVFDAPDVNGSYKHRVRMLPTTNRFILRPKFHTSDPQVAFKRQRKGEEGIVLRNPDGPYYSGRSRKFGLKKKHGRKGVAIVDDPGTSARVHDAETGVAFRLYVAAHDQHIQRGDRVVYRFMKVNKSGVPRDAKFESVQV